MESATHFMLPGIGLSCILNFCQNPIPEGPANENTSTLYQTMGRS